MPRRQSPSRSQSSSRSPSQTPDESSLIPFYNTTFVPCRVSPLYIGKEPLTSPRLQTIAQRLRDTLVGDVVRGVEVGLGRDGDDPILGRAGALEAVEIRWVGMDGVLDMSTRGGVFADQENQGSGLYVVLRYENVECVALLVPGIEERQEWERFFVGEDGGEADETQFLRLPLLLLRMPAPLKAVVCGFLEATFDCRISPLRLGTRSLVRSWEAWIRTAGLPTRGATAKDFVVTLGFYIPPKEVDGEESDEEEIRQLGLKSVDLFIPVGELRKFVGAADATVVKEHKRKTVDTASEDDPKKRRKLAGRLQEEGWEWRMADAEDDPLVDQPFTEALACYVDQHLGLRLFHPGTRIIRIACGGFVMSEGRLKLFAPADLGEGMDGDVSSTGQRAAIFELLQGLVQKAQGRDVTA
ncbi:hypothetical protein OQA88_10581 [Cercophora sp. LCS_1]